MRPVFSPLPDTRTHSSIVRVKRPPESFIRDYETFREGMDWFEAGGLDEDVVRAQNFYNDVLDFLDRWQGNVGVSELEEALGKLRPTVNKIGQALEIEYRKALRDLLEKRHSVLIEPILFKADIAFLGIMKNAPDSLQPELKKIFRESQGYDFDAERFYRRIEKDGQDNIAEYEQAFAAMEVTWPDHFTAETRARLTRAPIEEINVWKAAVSSRLEESDPNRKAG